ncbi:IS3 family transposase, partial [Streptococcus equi]|nr:IS3 family transposase [Streptococcus equi]
GRSQRMRKAETIREMVQEGFRLNLLLEIAKMARSTYYYQVKQLAQEDKDMDLKELIQGIYDEHHGNYGYRSIHL